MGKDVRLLSVSSVDLSLNKSNPPTLLVVVAGLAATPGYQNVRLEILEKELSPDGIFDLELVGEPPSGVVPQVVTPAQANIVIEREVERIVGVMVHARTNSITRVLGASAGRAFEAAGGAVGLTPLPDGPYPFPWPRNPGVPPFPWPWPPRFPKTMAIGEDGPWTVALHPGEGSGPYFLEKDPRTENLFTADGGEGIDPYVGLNPFGGR
ncbi:MAG: hypothetical protein CML30_14935 [Rhizobiales bacterium]|nr:hypothetical protein [Hyphomicrobiales bacterium]